MDKVLGRYFIALLPPPELSAVLNSFRIRLRDAYGTSEALKSPPHVTLQMPFHWKERKEESLVESLREFCRTQTGIQVLIRDFGCFPPRVIFAGVEQSAELIELQEALSRWCRRELNLFSASYKDLPWHPHITLAFRDLRKDLFPRAWDEFREQRFDAKFRAEDICLLKHEGRQWHNYVRVNLTA